MGFVFSVNDQPVPKTKRNGQSRGLYRERYLIRQLLGQLLQRTIQSVFITTTKEAISFHVYGDLHESNVIDTPHSMIHFLIVVLSLYK